MMKKYIKIVILTVIVLVVFFLVLHIRRNQEDNDYQKRGALLIEKIETFRQLERRLPNNVKELGLEESMNEGPYYEKKDSVTYVVFFNIGFDNTKIYYSDKKEWRNEP